MAMRTVVVLKVVALSTLLYVICTVIIYDGSLGGSPFLITRSDNLKEFIQSLPDPVNITLPTTEMPPLSSLVQNFASLEDEVLYIYQKYLLANWTPRPERLKMMRREIFRSSHSTQVDQMTLALSNINNKTRLPFYQPNLSQKAPKYKPSAGLLKYLPKNATFQKGTLFNKCSVVGNAGLLLGSACGKEIDTADYVFRCNMVPIEKFSEDAGLKTNFTTMNPSIVKTRYNNFKRDSDVVKFNLDLKEYSGNLFLPCMLQMPTVNTCVNKILPTIRNTHGRLAARVGNSEHLVAMLTKWKSAGIHLMSTGFYLTQIAITLCNEVHLFGFWSFSKTMYPVPRALQYHFFDGLKKSTAHSFNTEFQTLWQLHMSGIIKIHVHDCDV